jgi:hypothetical protein
VLELIGAAGVTVGVWWILRSVRTLVRGALSRAWPETAGVIDAAKVVKKFNSRAREVWREELEYSYGVGGTRYRGTRRRFGVPARYDWNDAQTRPLRQGETVSVVYSTSNPALSALQRGFSPFAFLPMIGGGLMIWFGVRLLLL